MDIESFTCISCGHTNYLHVERKEVRVLDLTQDDIGLQIQIGHHRGLLLRIHPDGADISRALFAVSLQDHNSAWDEPDTLTHYFYKSDDTLTIWRPIS